jgi:glucose-1-phosphate thymidylyltransferase
VVCGERLVVKVKGVILAGGSGSRLFPLTKITNKHLLPVYNKPMIYYPLQTLLDAGIKDILLVSGRGHAGHFLELLGSGAEFGCNITYEIQEEAGGIAQALGLAKHWADSQNIAVILGDNIYQDNIKPNIESFICGAKLFLKEVSRPERFGVPVFNNDNSIHYIEEKPTIAKSQFAVTGLYLYDRNVFSYIRQLTKSQRGELEITDVNNQYATDGKLSYCVLNGFWSDAGTFDSLLHAGQLVKKISEKK